MARISLNEAMSRPANVDRAKLDATTEDDIRRYKAEDGYADLDVPAETRTIVPPRQLRVGLGLTQREMATRLRVPFDTWRNWETGRVRLDPAVRSLLDLVAAFGEQALVALEPKSKPSPSRGIPAHEVAALMTDWPAEHRRALRQFDPAPGQAVAEAMNLGVPAPIGTASPASPTYGDPPKAPRRMAGGSSKRKSVQP